MYRLDSQRHINIIQAAIEIIQGEEVFIEDRAPLAETLKQHLELEKEALDNANKILNKTWVEENKGLKRLLELWRDDERRHHKGLKDLTEKPCFRLGNNDMVALFRGENSLRSVTGEPRSSRPNRRSNSSIYYIFPVFCPIYD